MQLPNFVGPNGFIWFIGVVENNSDPLQIGRIKVRAYGYHTDDANDLPTDDLPWAIHIKPTTGGSDYSPTGIEVGATVFGFFADGTIAQYPIVMGVIDGVNPREGADRNANSTQVLTDQAGGQSIIAGVPIDQQQYGEVPAGAPPTEPYDNDVKFIGNMSEPQYQSWKDAIGRRESGGNYSSINRFGFAGKYQFGNPALFDCGFTTQSVTNNMIMRDPQSWGGRKSVDTGVRSIEDFLANRGNCQEIAMDINVRRNYSALQRAGAITNATPARELGGYLAVAHLLGAGGAIRFARGDKSGRDGNGVSGQAYFNLGKNAVGT